jgi:fibronectin type 3 domain-containing protein
MSGTGVTGVVHAVDLSWNASTSSVSGYRVYRGTVTGGPYTLMTSSLVPSTTFTDNAVTSGDSYYYVVTAVDASNNESAFSNQAAATIPTP